MSKSYLNRLGRKLYPVVFAYLWFAFPVKAVELETVIVVGEPTNQYSTSETHYYLSPEFVENIKPVTSDEVIKYLPSANVTTNSRGETLVNLRGGGERQVALFFDGAVVNVPWDNRYDLALFPADAIGHAASATGTLSPQYGVNALASIALLPKSELAGGANVNAGLTWGSEQQQGFNVAWNVINEEHSGLLSASFYQRDGLALAERNELAYHQNDERLRTNTDYRRHNVYGHHRWQNQEWQISSSLVYAATERGIAPESDRPDDVRFWRYPKADTLLGVANAKRKLQGGSLSITGWFQRYWQTIDSYTDVTYTQLEDRQEDEDTTLGVRAVYERTLGATEILISASGLSSLHQQTEYEAAEVSSDLDQTDDQNYRQLSGSIGVDIHYELSRTVGLELGFGLDRVDYKDAGPHEAIEPFTEPTMRLGVGWQANNQLRIRAAIGEKYRFPTMRELYGSAINRFLINPDLQAERIRSIELGGEWFHHESVYSITAFVQELKNTIDQQRVDGLRQRINLKGAQIAGVELHGHWVINSQWNILTQATIMNARRKTQSSIEPEQLTERPEQLGMVRVGYRASNNSTVYFESEYRGSSFSPDETGELIELESAMLNNLALSLDLSSFISGGQINWSINNLTDEYYLLQAGLPAAGRNFQISVQSSW